MTKKFFLKYYLPFLAFSLLFLNACQSQKDQKPNIIFILADDMGYGDVAFLNPDSTIATPNLDKLAGEGMYFTDAHSGSAVCTPTRYGILTGRYAWRSRLQKGVLWAWDEPLIEPGRITVGSFLQERGYSTACIGKWHLGWDWPASDNSKISDYVSFGNIKMNKRKEFGKKVDFSQKIKNGPLTKGFDYYFGVDVPNFPPYCFIENEKTAGIPSLEKPDKMFGAPGPMLEGWKLEEIMPALTRKAVEYIKAKPREKLFNKKKNEPFFLYFPLTAPHTPIAPSKEFQGKSKAGAYGDYVMEVDRTVGHIMKVLEETGQARNTLIVFTSDNGSPRRDGTNMSGPVNSVLKYGHNPSYIFRGIKSDSWEGGHHIPFIARWPGKIESGTRSDEVICLTDFFATCAAILGDELPENAGEDSYNLLPALFNEKMDKPLREATIHHSIGGSFSVRRGKWKLILAPGSGGWSLPNKKAMKENLPLVQLYDLNKDIGEKVNLQGEYPQVVMDLTLLLEKYLKNGRSTPGAPQKNDGSPDIWKAVGIGNN